jgi:hypothetical protein
LIVADFPALFAEFCGRRRRDCHARCNGHANTLPPILDTEWDIFGGLHAGGAGVARADRKGRGRIPVDPRRKRFLLTLKNLCNFPMKKLLKTGEKNSTIGEVATKGRLRDNKSPRLRRSKGVNQKMRRSMISGFPFVIGEIGSREHSRFRHRRSPNTLSKCEARNDEDHKRTLWRRRLRRNAVAAIQKESEKNPSR